MGGFGSGNWFRFSSKHLVEKYPELDVRFLNKKGGLDNRRSCICNWRDGSNISIETSPEAIELSYATTITGQRQNVNYRVPLSWTTCNYGGKRPWLICPGKGCGRRVAKLYLRKGYFLCRHCHDLTYSSQRKTKESRQMSNAGRIYRKLGIRFNGGPYVASKPKGMHYKTYIRLLTKANILAGESTLAIQKMMLGFKQHWAKREM